jgi:alpha-L-fucosidase
MVRRCACPIFTLIFVIFVRLPCLCGAAGGEDPPSGRVGRQGEPAADRTAWFREAKFGMFIHWGPYSLASVEASWPIMTPDPNQRLRQAEYVELYRKFNPTGFDPRAWVRLAREAGQRYMVFTTKHHDGFCMFDSALTDYKITNTPYGKDIVAELAAAAKAEGMPLGFYDSPPDMHHPGYRDTTKLAKENWHGQPERPEWASYLNYMEGQLRELLSKYGKVAIVWFDGLDHPEKYDGARFHKLIHESQPDALINNRLGLPGDYETPEQFIPDRIPTKSSETRLVGTEKPAPSSLPGELPASPEDFQLWETCLTINNTWAYNKNDRAFKSSTELIRTLVEVASKGGNLLLDVGPTPEGTIQPEFQQRLLAIGRWLRVNGVSIYGTTYGPLQNLPWGKTTARGSTIYVHVFDWPKGRLELSGLRARVTQAVLVASGQALKFKQTGDVLSIKVPGAPPDPAVSVIALRAAE